MVETAVAVVLLAALVKKLMDVIKYFRAKDVNGYATVLVSMVVGVLAVLLVARTDFASAVSLGGVALDDANLGSQILIGLAVASTAGLITDFFSSLDEADSSATPPLVPEELPPPMS